MLEPYEGKLSCTVLRGERGRKPSYLPDDTVILQVSDLRVLSNLATPQYKGFTSPIGSTNTKSNKPFLFS